MKIVTKDITIELEPELLTDEHVERIKTLIDAAFVYEARKTNAEMEAMERASKLAHEQSS